MKNFDIKLLEGLEKSKYIVGAAVALLVISLPFFGASQYLLRVATNIGIYAILALSLNLITGYAGQVSLGHAAFMAIGAYAFIVFTTKYPIGFFPAMGVGILFSALAGLILGAPTLRLSGAYFVIATTGFSELVKVIALNWKSVTNGATGIRNIIRPTVFGIELTNANGGQYWFMLFWLAVSIYICYAIKYSKFGRALFAIRDDDLAAKMAGINTSLTKVTAFVFSAALAGVAGVLYATMTRYVEPNTFTMDISTIILCIVIFGGMGSMVGMLISTFLLIAFPEALRALAMYRFIIYGLILIIMVRFRQQGLISGVSKLPYKLPKGVYIDRG